MAVNYKDYYKVLGVAHDADAQAIQKAFRKLARVYHPDVAQNKKTAEARFKEINEANEVLGDPEKRRKYDELGAGWDQPEYQKSRQTENDPGRRSRGGSPAYHFDGTGFSDFFEQYFGSRYQEDGGINRPGESFADPLRFPQDGQDIVSDILVTLNEALNGATRMIRLQQTDAGTGLPIIQTLRIKIPPGVREGQMIRILGKGGDGSEGGHPGSLFLRVALARHPDLRVEGNKLFHDLELSPWEAVLGVRVSIPTLDGPVMLKIPAGTISGREFRLRAKGLPMEKGVRGDLHAVVSIQVPSQVSAEQKVAWENLARVSGEHSRTAP